jgi:hypothetical protein
MYKIGWKRESFFRSADVFMHVNNFQTILFRFLHIFFFVFILPIIEIKKKDIWYYSAFFFLIAVCVFLFQFKPVKLLVDNQVESHEVIRIKNLKFHFVSLRSRLFYITEKWCLYHLSIAERTIYKLCTWVFPLVLYFSVINFDIKCVKCSCFMKISFVVIIVVVVENFNFI